MLKNLPQKIVILIVSAFTIIFAGLFILLIGPIQEWLPTLSTTWGLVASIALLLVTLVWSWYRSREFIFQGAMDKKSWRDLRVWATVLMLVMIIVYFIFK